MRSITTLDLQYAHRFYGFKGEAQYLHGHTGVLTIEVEDSVEPCIICFKVAYFSGSAFSAMDFQISSRHCHNGRYFCSRPCCWQCGKHGKD